MIAQPILTAPPEPKAPPNSPPAATPGNFRDLLANNRAAATPSPGSAPSAGKSLAFHPGWHHDATKSGQNGNSTTPTAVVMPAAQTVAQPIPATGNAASGAASNATSATPVATDPSTGLPITTPTPALAGNVDLTAALLAATSLTSAAAAATPGAVPLNSSNQAATAALATPAIAPLAAAPTASDTNALASTIAAPNGGNAAATPAPPNAAGPANSATTATANAAPPIANSADPTANALPAIPGAAELNARIAAGAPAVASQPRVALASLSPVTAQSAAAHPPTPPAPPPDALKTATNEAAAAAKSQGQASTANPASGNPAPTTSAPMPAAANDHSIQPSARTTGTPADQTVADFEAATSAATNAGRGGDDQRTTSNDDQGAGNATPPVAPSTAPSSQAAPQAADPRAPAPIIPAAEQVAISLKQAVKTGNDEIQIQLKPASLGAIDVKLNVAHDGRVTAVISADRSDTLNMLRQDSTGLEQALRDAGLQADSGSLSFNLRGDAQFSSQNAPQGHAAPAPSRFADDVPGAIAASTVFRRHAGTIDIHV